MGVLDQCGASPAPNVISNNVEQAAQVCSLPLPPQQYIANYTDENIKRGKAPRPPPPVYDTYSMFGNTFNADDTIIRPLETQGIKRLYPHNFDRRRELRKLNHSLLVNFLDLLDLLVRCPESGRRAEKVEDLSLLFIHIHHLLNEFRPHQARETLRVMMELQKRQRHEISQRFQKHLDKVIEMLHQALQTLPDTSDFDSKLIVPTESFENMDKFNSNPNNPDRLSVLDDIMCSVVDQL
ncbi:Mediator of RNA polymerase II transcription subunit 24 [Nesidiocoris tenuis]|uniref:Mediator of RNA polymerase II transcription subunit 7 n=1 Tax=Nesidiocoris tenuis TaxID=355587 RepID=A0ABN7ASI7_9HEMI|nr:Mediator of RNA polymerase II transcription subunit 24 [Nesidiocoris tenuis]